MAHQETVSFKVSTEFVIKYPPYKSGVSAVPLSVTTRLKLHANGSPPEIVPDNKANPLTRA